MVRDTYNVALVIFSDNCLAKVRQSLDSALGQSFESKRVKVVVIDNASTDDSYTQLLELAKERGFALYRLNRKVLPAQQLKWALQMLKYFDYRYMTFLNAGDILYPDFVAACSETLDRYQHVDRRMVVCEAGLVDDTGEVVEQKPLFSQDCILLKREHYLQFFINGTGHKIQAMYALDSFPKHLSDLVHCVDYSDWFKKAMLAFHTGCVYLTRPLAAVPAHAGPDLLDDLVLRLYLVKRLDLIRDTVFSDVSYTCLDDSSLQQKVDSNLALLAMQYSARSLHENLVEEARKILVFAEMVDKGVTSTKLFSALSESVSAGRLDGAADRFRAAGETVSPPEYSLSLG